MLSTRHVHRQTYQLLSPGRRSVSPPVASPALLSRISREGFLRACHTICLFLRAAYGAGRGHRARHPGPRLLGRRALPLLGIAHVNQPPPPQPPRAPTPRPRTPRGPPWASRRPPSRTRDAAPRSPRRVTPSPPLRPARPCPPGLCAAPW